MSLDKMLASLQKVAPDGATVQRELQRLYDGLSRLGNDPREAGRINDLVEAVEAAHDSYVLGRAAHRDGDLDTAERHLRRAVDADFDDAAYQLARVLEQQAKRLCVLNPIQAQVTLLEAMVLCRQAQEAGIASTDGLLGHLQVRQNLLGQLQFVRAAKLPAYARAPRAPIRRLIMAVARSMRNMGRSSRNPSRLAPRSVFDQLPEAIIVLDTSRHVTDLNQAARTALRIPRSVALGRPIEQLVPTVTLDGGDDVPAEEELRLDEDGVERIWELARSTLHDARGRRTGWLLVLRDVTERHHAQERLRQINEARRSLLARVVDAQEQERRRIASDIHDDSIQAMAAAMMRLQLVRKRSHDADQLDKIDALESALAQAIERLRHLLFHLRPPVLDELGLAAALRQYLEYSKPEEGWEARVEASSTAELSSELRVTAYRIVQEAIANARRHARARNLLVRIQDADGGIRVGVQDDGVGFDADLGRLETQPGRLGIAGMRERAAMAGGWWRLESQLGTGTLVEFWLPAVLSEPQPTDRAALPDRAAVPDLAALLSAVEEEMEELWPVALR